MAIFMDSVSAIFSILCGGYEITILKVLVKLPLIHLTAKIPEICIQ